MNNFYLKPIGAIIFSLLTISTFAQPWLVGGNLNAQLGGSLTPSIGTNQNRPLLLETNSFERMRITPVGWLGVGTNNPQSFTHFHNPATGFFQSSFTQWTNPAMGTNLANRGLFVGNLGLTAIITQAEAAEMFIATAGTTRVTIRGTTGATQGFVGIGTGFTNPIHLLDARNGDINCGNGTPASPQGYMIGDGKSICENNNQIISFLKSVVYMQNL